MPRGMYKHEYTPIDNVEYILGGSGLSPQDVRYIIDNYVTADYAERLLKRISNMQAEEQFTGTSDTVLQDVASRYATEQFDSDSFFDLLFEEFGNLSVAEFSRRLQSGEYDELYF